MSNEFNEMAESQCAAVPRTALAVSNQPFDESVEAPFAPKWRRLKKSRPAKALQSFTVAIEGRFMLTSRRALAYSGCDVPLFSASGRSWHVRQRILQKPTTADSSGPEQERKTV